ACVIAAALTYRISIILAVVFLVGGAVIPWCAVVIANDGPPHKREHRVGPTDGNSEAALPRGQDDRTVDN
ncbi:MAG: DUF3099 domain-containing protein, partial [Trebonia sp.]